MPHAGLRERTGYAPGDLVAGYRLLAQVGAGGTAQVFRAEERGTRRVVAFKALLPGLRQSASLAKRCHRETRIAMRLAHENIVRVYDAGEDAGAPFLVMEWLSGEDLRTHLARRGSFEPREAVRLMLPVCSAVAYGHAMGVIHRDIKLDNIVLHQVSLADGSVRLVPKLVDFGISRLVGATALTLDARRCLLGTPQYMAPEQARGEAEAGPAVDQHGLAVALYVLLCGHFPRAVGSVSEMVKRVALEGFVPLAARAPSLPADLVSIVERGMALDAGQRFESVELFARALADWLRRSHAEAGDTLVEPVSTLPESSTAWLRGIGGESGRHLELPHPHTRRRRGTLPLCEPTRATTLVSPPWSERDRFVEPACAPPLSEAEPRSSLSAPGSELQVVAPNSELKWMLVAGLLGALVVASLVLSAGLI